VKLPCTAARAAYGARVDTKPPANSTAREIVERTVEASISAVPLAGGPLAVAFAAAFGYRLSRRRDRWLEELAEVVRRLSEQGLDPETLADNDLFVDAVVSTTRIIEHTHQQEKIEALRNAVLNSVAPDAPDADTQAIFLSLLDRFTPSHLRLLVLLNDPPAWFAARGIPVPQAGMAGSRTQTVEAGLPEMAGRQPFYNLLVGELNAAGLMNASVMGMVSASAIMDSLTTDLGAQFVRFVMPPAERA
jgi:hypothetical protein